MAFGIDDAISAAAAGISLTDTIVQTVQRYRKGKKNLDLELLLEQVRITALERINDADAALNHLERLLIDRKVDLNRQLIDAIHDTPFWKPFEQHRLTQAYKRLNQFAESIYQSGDDIAALVRCQQNVEEMGTAVFETSIQKRAFQDAINHAKSVKETLHLLRSQLDAHKANLNA